MFFTSKNVSYFLHLFVIFISSIVSKKISLFFILCENISKSSTDNKQSSEGTTKIFISGNE